MPNTSDRLTGYIQSARTTIAHVTGQLGRRMTRKRLLVTGGVFFLLLAFAYSTLFFVSRTVTYSYTASTCFTNPVLFPGNATTDSQSFAVNPQPTLAVLGYPIYSQVSCITPKQAPQDSSIQNISFGGGVFSKTIHIHTGKQASIKDSAELRRAVPIKDTLVLHLSSQDKTFTYQLSANNQSVQCTTKGKDLRCDAAKLGLEQSTSYQFTVERLFKQKVVKTIFARSLTTVEAIHVAGSSISGGAMVYDKPRSLALTMDKPIKEIGTVQLKQVNGAQIPVTALAKDNLLTVAFTNDLPRTSTFELVVQDITSREGGFLPEPYVLAFSTSGGPKVTGVNIGNSRLAANPSITVTFDTALAASQAFANFAQIDVNGSVVASAISTGSKSITLKPTAALPRCGAVTVKILDGLQNEYDVSGGSGWQFKSRVLCQTSFSIGTSVRGRAIMAYSFGTGPSKIVFVGGTHGNERSSAYILNRWIDYLESNPGRIPGNRTLIIIPVVNPDGYAANSRTNAHNVDLNRNFPSNSWKSGVTMPDHSYLEYGGGTAPLSEPESRALANYVLSQSPRLVLTYHASGGVVVPNDSGDSDAIARTYGAKSSVGYMGNSGTPTFFEYDTTGAFEDWLHDKYGIPALLIELLEKNDNEFSGHQNALLYILGV